MLELNVKPDFRTPGAVAGSFVSLDGERYYAIRNVDRMPPFFISVVSEDDHWLFVSSNGGLTAGRISPENALFPYIPVDKIHECGPHTGSKTIIHVDSSNGHSTWEPFNREHDDRYAVTRNLYKSISGDKLSFEEINHDLKLSFRYTWSTSDRFGFVRRCELRNLGKQRARGEFLDGLQNILPAGAPAAVQANASNLVDAYKWTELDSESGLAIYTLYSRISDRAQPSESLRANTVFCLGLSKPKILLSSEQVASFRKSVDLSPEKHNRGIRGAYLVNASFDLEFDNALEWTIVADVGRTQSQVVMLNRHLGDVKAAAEAVSQTVSAGSDRLARMMASGDALQVTGEEPIAAHHYANVVFNNLRGGLFDNNYTVKAEDFATTVRHFNDACYQANHDFLRSLPESLPFTELLAHVEKVSDTDLERLCHEFLPIRFGRRHGDPSRPWNWFSISLRDDSGARLLSYEGNWRDIFQNWEALAFSFPGFINNIIAKFVNASTVDGYNPYRISNVGIDWEVEDPDDPWTYIGYWGDHQVVYLLKLLELSSHFYPDSLVELLRKPVFAYANVPYRIRPLEEMLRNPKSTVDFDHGLAERIERRVTQMGADGKLVLDSDGRVYRANLLEKLLVPLLAKLGNLVVDGGIWLNTQRPEWNDANNALVGNGLSMVTLYYLRRYLVFLQALIAREAAPFELSSEVSRWLDDTAAALGRIRQQLDEGPVSPEFRYASMVELGQAASLYRQSVYTETPLSGKVLQPVETVRSLIDDSLLIIDHSTRSGKRGDGLFEAYNLLELEGERATTDALYPMLEGQVAILSSGLIDADEACDVLEALFESDIYRADQQSFMLYADRNLPGFLEKNRVPEDDIERVPLFPEMLSRGDERVICRDIEGAYRFNADICNVDELDQRLDKLVDDYGDAVQSARAPIKKIYERVFNHRKFTGRSGTMFGFEGLGCVYWHMVSKLLLAVQENYFTAIEQGCPQAVSDRLAYYYYRVREGLGFNKTPAEYGAFPTDPYSHTPKHAGAQQPGMTGQVKEEILTRFGELGVRVADGIATFTPKLLRPREFLQEQRPFRYLDVDGDWHEITVPAGALAFTWCQVPVLYCPGDNQDTAISITAGDGTKTLVHGSSLSANQSAALFQRDGSIREVRIALPADILFDDARTGAQ